MEGMSQRQFSDKIGVKQTSISNWLTAGNEPVLSAIGNIAKSCGVSTDWLFGFSDDKYLVHNKSTVVTGDNNIAIAGMLTNSNIGANAGAKTTSDKDDRMNKLEAEMAELKTLMNFIIKNK